MLHEICVLKKTKMGTHTRKSERTEMLKVSTSQSSKVHKIIVQGCLGVCRRHVRVLQLAGLLHRRLSRPPYPGAVHAHIWSL